MVNQWAVADGMSMIFFHGFGDLYVILIPPLAGLLPFLGYQCRPDREAQVASCIVLISVCLLCSALQSFLHSIPPSMDSTLATGQLWTGGRRSMG